MTTVNFMSEKMFNSNSEKNVSIKVPLTNITTIIFRTHGPGQQLYLGPTGHGLRNMSSASNGWRMRTKS